MRKGTSNYIDPLAHVSATQNEGERANTLALVFVPSALRILLRGELVFVSLD